METFSRQDLVCFICVYWLRGFGVVILTIKYLGILGGI